MADTKSFENSLTVREKLQYFDSNHIDYSYLDEWRDCRTLLNDKYFKEMLQINQQTKEAFAFALQPLNLTTDSFYVNWLKDYQEIIEAFNDDDIEFDSGVSILAIPFVKYLRGQILKKRSELKNIAVDTIVVESFLNSLVQELFNVFGKILALKLAEFKSENTLTSEDKAERLKEFLQRTLYSKERFLALYQEYPVATRLATTRTLFALKNYNDLLSRLDKDSKEIKDFLSKDKLELSEVSVSEGDSHGQGKSVMILHFGNSKLVYKPKNLEISKALEQFIEWYSSRSALLPLKLPKGIYKKDYTYNEFIASDPCKTGEDINEFYVRYGYLVAICYLLNINDLHMENIVAKGKYPVIVDLETIFQTSTLIENESVTIKIIRRLEEKSVKKSCLLPSKLSVGVDTDVELSAFKGVEVQLPNQFVTPVNIDTDDFHFEKGDGVFKGGNNIPTKQTTEGVTTVDYNQYRLRILEGFNAFMQFILDNKKDLLAFMDTFKGYQVRTLLKATEKYASLLRYSNHPVYNQEMKYRERLLMNAWAYPYSDKRVIVSEIEDMLFNDIPIFYAKTDSRDILDSRGQVYQHYYKQSGLDVAVEKLKQLDSAEINFQRNILLAALDISDLYLNNKQYSGLYSSQAQSFDYLKSSIAVADYLTEHGIEYNEEISFINLDCDKDLNWNLLPSDEGLYSGTSGTALFFLELYRRTKEAKYHKLYQKVIAAAVSQAEQYTFSGAYQGWLAPLYPLLLEYSWFDTTSHKKFLDLTIEKLKELNSKKLEDYFDKLDYVGGLAGVLRLLQKADAVYAPLGDILKNMRGFFLGQINQSKAAPLKTAGVAHGISGVVLGLISAAEFDKSLVDSLLLKEMEIEISEEDSLKWCKGLPGLIQTRLSVLKVYGSEVAKEQLETLLQKFKNLLQNAKTIKDDSLCHGLSGIITVVRDIVNYTHSRKWKALLNVCVSQLYTNALFEPYRLPRLGDITAKGLFDGISGIGLAYLYAEDGEQANILSFDI